MTKLKITGPAVDTLMRSAVPNKTTYYFDDDLAGFGLYRTTTGTGTYFAEFRPVAGGSKKRLKLGRVGTLKPSAAREAARKAIANAALGRDLASERSDERASITVAELLELYIRRTREKRKERTANGYASLAQTNIVPQIGNMKAVTVTRIDVQRMHSKVGGAKYAANRSVVLLKAAYSWAAKQGYLAAVENPASGIDMNREKSREHFLNADEMRAIGEAMHEAETVGLPVNAGDAKHSPKGQMIVMSPHVTAAIRLLMLTGCRLREILDLRWKEVDLNQGVLRLADSKTGKKVVFLPSAAIDILTNIPRIGAFVIAGDSAGTKKEKPRADLKRPWQAILKRAGVKEARLHDLRRSFAAVGAGQGHGLPAIGALLGHANASTTKRYAHIADEASRRAVDAIGGEIAKAIGGK
ncbi:integrase [Nitrobacter vulgaris]|uniref:tyrosine-type recombinase/integrase n=1 Tax=Nitrobacter vulgaris TaxID=29421 RepID=UPI00285A8C83|nr:site-specific integrase [Nitrobacter vulgaris]MDR6304948.1 integrase [Nitrobacter vulgaris]